VKDTNRKAAVAMVEHVHHARFREYHNTVKYRPVPLVW
jgi:hypothetical protein